MSLYQKSKAKQILSDKEQLASIVHKTMDKMAAIVGATLGPGGRPVLIERDGMPPLVTKDGVTVAKALGVDDASANIVVEAAKEICINTAKEAGDGTTTAIVLADALVKHGNQFIADNPKYNAQRIVNELNECYDTVVVPFLEQQAIKVKTDDQLKDVATISANGDKTIAEAVVKAVMAAGNDGTVLIEEAQGGGLRVDTADGYLVTTGLKEHGQIGPVFINDRGNQQARMDNGLVFLYDGSINDLQVPGYIQSAIENTEHIGKPIIVVAHQFSDVALDRFAKTFKGGITVVPVRTPGSGLPNGRSMFLHDLAAYTSGTVMDPGNIGELEIEHFGEFNTAKVNMYETYIQSDIESERIEQRIIELKAIMEAAFSEMDKSFLRAAIAKLTGGVSTIWVGGSSDLEIREKKARVEDAVEAVRSAVAEGVVPGGCGVHLVLADMIDRHPDKKQSWSIMSQALRAPFQLLLSNCGENPSDVWPALEGFVVNKDSLPKAVFDANQHKMVDPFAAGIIEPAKVCRVSIGNALSVASLLITLGGIVVVPRDANLENQLAMSAQAFKDMMGAASE